MELIIGVVFKMLSDIVQLCIFRVHDVYTNRILQVLSSMQKVTLQALPSDDPWTVEEFIDKTEETCRHAAMVSQYSS